MTTSVPTDFVYNNARFLFATAGLNWLTDNICAMLVSASYSQSLAHVNVSDIPSGAIIARDAALTSKTATNGICAGLIPKYLSLAAVPAVAAVIIYKLGVDDAHSPLIYYSSTGIGFPFAAVGFDYYITYDLTNLGYFQV